MLKRYISATSTTTDKPIYADRTPPNYSTPPALSTQPQQYFFNCAAPKSVLQQNCQAMRQVQQHYPPYPHHVGVHQIHPPPGVPFMGPTSTKQPSNQKIFSSSTLPANSQAARAKRNPNGNNRRTPSILKHYKSCPVSPVHEEVEWSSDSKSIIITEPKRHSVYADDARTILDMIQADTEKMIAEITKKYGDLDDIGVDVYDHASGTRHSQIVASKSVPENLATQRNNLPIGQKRDLAFTPEGAMSPRGVKQPYVPLAPKHSFSEFYVYQEIYQCERKVSLSDILNDNPEQMAEARRLEEARFLETQRHSSASFFLTSNNPFNVDRSQESLLTEEFLDDASYCNSMESILSDESDCKSAPLVEMVDKPQPPIPRHAGLRNFIIHGPTSTIAAAQMVSKSYGSSPNAYGSFDYYMQQRHLQTTPSNTTPYESFDVSSYNLEKIKTNDNKKSIPPKPIPTSKTYPKLSESSIKHPINSSSKVSDDIPTSKYKNQQYSSGVSKSISSDFAQQRWQRNSNPMQADKGTYNDKLFQKKVVKEKPPIPAKPENLKSTLTSTVEAVQKLQVKEPLKKSCSFEVDTSDIRCHSRTASVVRKFERNLQKFEREKQAELQAQKKKNNEVRQMRPSVSSGALATQSCLKKVSKFDNSPSRRATSMRQKERPKISVRFNTVSQIKYTPSSKRNNANNSSLTTTCPLNDINLNVSPPLGSSLPNDYGEKTFEMFITENGNDEHDNMTMDSLKLYTKPTLQAVVDEIKQERERDSKHKKNLANKEITQNPTHDNSTTNQCKNIAKQIDVIQKLIEMEERKLEQIRQATESRMRPFECDTKQRGYVKSLTMNFDMLAKGIEKDIENEQRRILADSSDSDLCAYARHIKRNVSLPDVLESTESYNFNKKLMQQVQLDCDGMEVEIAKEVKADSDADNEDEKEDESEKVSLEHIERVAGNPKNLNPMPVEESSSIRRACSLSDLHMVNVGKGGKSASSSQKTGAAHRNSSATRSANKRNSLQNKGSSNNLSANASMGVLNQSDSETEANNRGRTGSNGQSRTNGPTASNRPYNNTKTNGNNNRRKGALQTSFNNAPPQDDSSSEETQGSSSNPKPIVPPRPRNLAFDHKSKIVNSPNVVKQRGVYEAVEFADLDSNGDPKSQVHNVINKLYTTTQTVLQLHANLRNCEDSLMLKELENAVIMTQNMLTNITQNKNDKNNQHPNHTYSTTEQANLENGDYMMMVNNCADLLSNLRMKHKPDDCENNS